eukprot:scaffold121453_cov48-Phaeocystis_antarctica.AAC.2
MSEEVFEEEEEEGEDEGPSVASSRARRETAGKPAHHSCWAGGGGRAFTRLPLTCACPRVARDLRARPSDRHGGCRCAAPSTKGPRCLG